jgi:8-oxo-dGTP diphosphatase
MPLIVVAAALIGNDGKILLQRRPVGKMHGGLWEFPGGKREAKESSVGALARELDEELGIDVDTVDFEPLGFSVEQREKRELILLLFACRRWLGKPKAVDGAVIQWVEPGEVANFAMPPADVPLARQLPGWLGSSSAD